MLLLALKKVRMVKITPCQIPTTQQKFTQQNIPSPLGDFPYYLENPIMWVQLGSKMAKKVIFIPATSLPTNFSLKTKFLTAIVS